MKNGCPRLAAVLFSLVGAWSSSAHAQSPADKLVGIWASETESPNLHGRLSVARNGSDWIARISSAETKFSPAGDSVRFTFPGLGQFRGTFTADKRAIRGWWIQPGGNAPELGAPGTGDIGQPYASRTTLALAQPSVWRGDVVPLEDRYSLFLSVWKRSDGVLLGAFRNPEANLRGGASRFRVTLAGDSVIFTAPTDTVSPTVRRAARFDSANKQLVIYWPQLGRTLVLTPRAPEQAVGFFPRVPAGYRYTYAQPSPENDGWTTAPARTTGLDQLQLQTVVQRIVDSAPTIPTAPMIHSLLIAHRGKLVLEEYFFGWDRERMHDTRSAGKSFASILFGAAMLQGAHISPETPIAELMTRQAPYANPDPRKQRITLANLMTHSSGLACDDNDDNSPGNEGTMQAQTAQPDWWKYILDLPMIREPGSHYAYCSGGSNLVGGAVAMATHSWLPEFFDKSVAQPLQFGRYYYNLSPTLDAYTGGGVFIRPRDLLKLGQLYLNGGVWNGKRIVSQSWVTLSTAKHIEWPYQNQNVSAGADGYMWHLNTVKSGGREYREFEANGNGGQLLMVFPELDLAVVFTAGNYQNGGVWGRFRDEIVGKAIIPAMLRNGN